MVLDPWVEKAWRLYRETECFPDMTIQKAVQWLETRHHQTPHWNTAVVIALHYLILAMREKVERNGALSEYYLSRATHWKAKAIGGLERSAAAETPIM
jgi:hypothetical protein